MSANGYGTYDSEKGTPSNSSTNGARNRDDLKNYSSGRRERDSMRDSGRDVKDTAKDTTRDSSYGLGRNNYESKPSYSQYQPRHSQESRPRDDPRGSRDDPRGSRDPRGYRDPRARENRNDQTDSRRDYKDPRTSRDDNSRYRVQRDDYSAYERNERTVGKPDRSDYSSRNDRTPKTDRSDYSAYNNIPEADYRSYNQAPHYQDRARERIVDTRDKSPLRQNGGRNFERNDYRDSRQRPQYKPRQGDFRQDYSNQGGYSKDSYSRPQESYSNDSYGKDSYGKDSYGKEPYGKDTYNNSKDPYNKPEVPQLSNEEQIKKYEKRLAALVDVPPIELIKVIDSRWGVKPKGFEDVTAQRAKLSGLFPLPGHPRPVDITKLEGAVKDRLSNSNDILNETSKVDAIDSRNAKILIVKNINFDHVNYLKVVQYFNDYLKVIDIDETSTNNIDSKRKTKDDKSLIVQFTNSMCATIVSALSGTKLAFNEFKEDSEPENESMIDLVAERPNEYVVQSLPPYKEMKDDVEEKVVDSPRKITVSVPEDKTETQILDELKTIAPIKAFQLLREIGTKQSLGLAFVEFYVDPAIHETSQAISKIQEYVDQVQNVSFVKNAFFSCKTQSIQDCPVDFRTLKSLVRNENVSAHPKLRVIQLINIVTAKDLMDDSTFQYTQKDIHQEVSKLGKIQSMKIPRPANDYTPGLVQFSQPGLGKVFIEFEDEESALRAIMELAGRLYNERTVLCAFHDHDDYKNGLF